jgi:catechol 2,3-dioxygenase-like lactoylglutathione lyase family enzyme
MRHCLGICGREMANPATGQKAGLLIGQHFGSLNEFGAGAYRLMICAGLTAPSMASFGSPETSETAMKIERIDHLNLTVADIGRSVDFYNRVLGMKAESMGEGRAALYFGQQKIHLDAAGGAMAVPGERMPAHICFITEASMGEITAHLERCGVPIRMQGPRTGAIGTIHSVYIDDPDHNSIEIACY